MLKYTIKQYMFNIVVDHIDPKTDILNLTSMAEEAMLALGADEGQEERFDEIAFEVFEFLLKRGDITG